MPAAARDHDVEEALRGPSSDDASESLRYWLQRLEGLPRRKVAARREARTMALSWERRLRDAEIERWGGGIVGRAAGTLAVLRSMRPRALVNRLVPRSLVVGVLTVVLGTTLVVGLLLGAILSALL